jgi:hypothetical protein
MLDQILQFIPAHDARLFELLCALSSTFSLFFAFFARTVWLSKLFGTVTPADLGRVWRYLLKGIELLQQWRAARKVIGGLLFVALALVLSGCAGTFEESTGKLSPAPAPRKAADPATCLAISRRASLEQGLAVAGAVLTGVDGIAAWPVESKTGRLGLAIGGTMLGSGTAMVLVLWQGEAAAYIEAGCATPKESGK